MISDRLHDDHLAIFLFHGVVPEASTGVRNYHGKHLAREVFARGIERLAAAGTALSMDDVLEHLDSNRPFPRRAFAVTFDDGFANNLEVAAPVIEAFDVPATVYVTTQFVDDNAMSWIDRIEQCVTEADRGAVRMPWSGEELAFDDRVSRIGVMEEIRRGAKCDAKLDVDELVRDIAGQVAVTAPESREDALDRKLTWEQVRELDRHPLFTIGGHTHTHPILAFLDETECAREIELCLERLKSEAGIETPHFSYPEGLVHCFNLRVAAALRDRGIRCCPTAIDGVNAPGVSPFALRRINVTPEMC